MVGAFMARTFSRSSRAGIDLDQKVKVGRVIPTSHMGQKQTWRSEAVMSALPPKDIVQHGGNVRFVPDSDSCTAAKSELFDHLVGCQAAGAGGVRNKAWRSILPVPVLGSSSRNSIKRGYLCGSSVRLT
jgi:hypothetical protein